MILLSSEKKLSTNLFYCSIVFAGALIASLLFVSAVYLAGFISSVLVAGVWLIVLSIIFAGIALYFAQKQIKQASQAIITRFSHLVNICTGISLGKKNFRLDDMPADELASFQ